MNLKEKWTRAMSYFVEVPPENATVAKPADSIVVASPTPPGTDAGGQETAFDASSEPQGNGAPGSSWNDALAAVERAQAEATAKVQTQAPPKTIEQIVRESDGPNLDEIKVNFGDALPVLSDGTLDFAAIYAKAALPDPPFTAEQMIHMLSELPAEMPMEMRRQTVKVTIGALGKHIGATPETIVTDASRKMAALAAFVETSETHTSELVAATDTEIAALLSQVDEKRRSVMAATQRLAAIQRACEREADRLDDVLGFFVMEGVTIAPSPIPVDVLAPLPEVSAGDTMPDTVPIKPGAAVSWERDSETPPPLPPLPDTESPSTR